MKNIKLYIHSEGNEVPEKVEVSSDITVKDLLARLLQLDFAFDGSEFALEDEEDFLIPSDRTLAECGINHSHHLHCHRCKKINVHLSYSSGLSHVFDVPPSTTVAKLIKLAIVQFKIDPATAVNLIIKSENGLTLDDSTHIGTLVKHDNCSIRFVLCPKVIIQG